MKTITILALHLGYGGIERAITDLANILIDNYNVEIISTYKIYNKPVNVLNPKIKVKYLINSKPNKKEFMEGLKNKNIKNIFKEGINSLKILYLKRKLMINYIKICKSDVIISTRDIHNKWLGKYGKKNILKIGWEHNHHQNNSKYIKKIIKSVKNLDYFVLVSKELNKFYCNKVKPKCVYIPNLIEENNNVSNLESCNIVSIGRLSKEKGFLDLIDIFKSINEDYSDWKLHIIGDGEEYNNIREKINNYNLENNVIMHGFLNKEEINKILINSSIYVMTSFTESFGIVLLEAMSFGIPCLAYTSAEGAKEIIVDNVNGYLIANRDKKLMIEKIKYLIENLDERKRIGQKGIIKIKEFSPIKVKNKWIEIIK